jgi:hypothetical protein
MRQVEVIRSLQIKADISSGSPPGRPGRVRHDSLGQHARPKLVPELPHEENLGLAAEYTSDLRDGETVIVSGISLLPTDKFIRTFRARKFKEGQIALFVA